MKGGVNLSLHYINNVQEQETKRKKRKRQEENKEKEHFSIKKDAKVTLVRW